MCIFVDVCSLFGSRLSFFNFSFNCKLLLVCVDEVRIELDALAEYVIQAGCHANLVLL